MSFFGKIITIKANDAYWDATGAATPGSSGYMIARDWDWFENSTIVVLLTDFETYPHFGRWKSSWALWNQRVVRVWAFADLYTDL